MLCIIVIKRIIIVEITKIGVEKDEKLPSLPYIIPIKKVFRAGTFFFFFALINFYSIFFDFSFSTCILVKNYAYNIKTVI